MKICLIFAPYQLHVTNKELAFRDDGIGLIPPLSLMSVGAILEDEGVDVKLIDMEAERSSYDDVLQRVKDFNPDMLAFTLTTYSFHPVLSWINKFKEDTGLPILVGGKHVELYPSETMSHKAIDFAIVGEAEAPLPEFIKAYKNGKSFTDVKSLCYRDDTGETHIDPFQSPVIDDLDTIPWPSQKLLKNELYSNILTRRKNFTAMMSSRGCPYRCTFCDQHRPKYRNRSARSFVDEVKYNYENFGIREFDIYDSTFTADRKRVIEICDLLVEENMDIEFTVRSTVMAVTHELIDALKRAGCHTIMYGIESSNIDILKNMKKRIPADRLWDRIQYTHDAGIQVLGFFIFGYPGETHETIQETIKLSLQLPLTYAQYTVLWPFPDTEIYQYYLDEGKIGDYWSEYTLDPTNEREIELVGAHISREEATNYLAQAYRKFYFRPRIFLHRVRTLKSFGEFKRVARAATGLLANSAQQYIRTFSFSHQRQDY